MSSGGGWGGPCLNDYGCGEGGPDANCYCFSGECSYVPQVLEDLAKSAGGWGGLPALMTTTAVMVDLTPVSATPMANAFGFHTEIPKRNAKLTMTVTQIVISVLMVVVYSVHNKMGKIYICLNIFL